MSIYPTRTAAHMALCGALLLAAGIVMREPVVVAWGGALLIGIALARSVTLVSVMRIRAAGFEMLWTSSHRVVRTHVGAEVDLVAEVRNRDTLAARYDQLRVMASPAIETSVEPLAGEVHANGSVALTIRVKPLRVGHHGIYGLALEVRGAPGLFEVPLTFANPFGIEVLPRGTARSLGMPQGGRSQTFATSGRSGRRRGDGTDLRELRERLPGDPFRRIAWKASARRGQLVVKEFEREERDVVTLLVDASVELWAGPMGEAPLDRIIDLCSSVALQHLRQGDMVGLKVLAARELGSLPPDRGRSQLTRLVKLLITSTGVIDADRCGWDESDLAVQVLEHMRPLDPRAAAELKGGKLDKLIKRATAMSTHAPFNTLDEPYGRSARDSKMRRYAACFGMHLPARLEPDRPRSSLVIAEALGKMVREKPRSSVAHVVAPPPDESVMDKLKMVVKRLKRHRIEVRWTTPTLAKLHEHQGSRHYLPPLPDVDGATQQVIEEATVTHAVLRQKRGEAALRRIGVRVIRMQRAVELVEAAREAGETIEQSDGDDSSERPPEAEREEVA